MHKKGIALNSVEKFSSHSADKIRRGTLLRFERVLLSKYFKQRRGEASGLCRNFLSHRTEKKIFVMEPFCFREKKLVSDIFMDKRGHVTISSQNF